MCGSGIGAGPAPVSGWQLRGSERGQGEPYSAGAVGGGGPSPSNRAPVFAGSGRAEPGGRAGARTGSGIDHRSRFHLCDQRRHAGASRLLRQLSGGQRELRDRGRASHRSTDEPGDRGRASYADPFRRVARTSARIGGSRHDVWERGVLTVVGGSEHHSLYANPRQYPQKEESILRSPAFHLRTGTRSLYLPCRSAPELRWPKSSQSLLDLHRDTQTVWPVPAPAAMHQCGFPLLGDPSTRTSPATRPGFSGHAGVREGTTAEKKSGSVVRRTEESDRTAPLASTPLEVRAGAVLSGGGCPEPQATGAVRRPTDSTSGSHHLARGRRTRRHPHQTARDRCELRTFSTPTPDYVNHLSDSALGGTGSSCQV